MGLSRLLVPDILSRLVTCLQDISRWLGVNKAWQQRLKSCDIWATVFSGKVVVNRKAALGSQIVAALAAFRPPQLEYLSLDFQYAGIGDKGAVVIAKVLPPTLKRLTLCLRKCRIGNQGGVAVGRKLQQLTELKELNLDFGYCHVDNNVVIAVAVNISKIKELEKLNLTFVDTGIGDEGVIVLAVRLPATLQKLTLDVNSSTGFAISKK